MVFSSIVFVFCFLPAVLLLYIVAEKTGNIKFKNLVMLIASVIFYSWGGLRYLFLLFFLILINYICGIMIEKSGVGSVSRRVFFIIAICADILDLVFFKYSGFIGSNIETLLKRAGNVDVSFGMPTIALPIGISFFTFQIMSYVIDVYWGKVPAQKNIFRLTLYIMMFPQLIAGPIVRYIDVNEALSARKTTCAMAEQGVKRFIIGFAKKVFLANAMGSMADAVFALSGSFNTAYAWLGAISYTLQIYFDFSAYSDMAIGLGLIFGFIFNENFVYPYTAGSIQEFWRRWHISLSTWFRDYVYIPLGGNRKGKIRTYINLWVVFLLTGIWHGAAWQFIVWGLYHGLFMFIERLGFGNVLKKLPAFLGHIYSCIVVIVGWVFFRADNLTVALNYIRNMFSFDFSNFKVFSVLPGLDSMYVFMLVVGILAALRVPVALKEKVKVPSPLMYAGYLILFGVSIIYLAGLSYNPFIYYKF